MLVLLGGKAESLFDLGWPVEVTEIRETWPRWIDGPLVQSSWESERGHCSQIVRMGVS